MAMAIEDHPEELRRDEVEELADQQAVQGGRGLLRCHERTAFGVGDDQRDPGEEKLRANRGDQRGDADRDDDEAVDQPADQANQQAGDQGENRAAGGVKDFEKADDRNRHDRAEGEVDLLGDDEQRQRHGDHAVVGHGGHERAVNFFAQKGSAARR